MAVMREGYPFLNKMIECICLHLMKFIYSYKRNGYSLWMNMCVCLCVRLQMTIHSLNKAIRIRIKITCGFICGDAIFWLKISGWIDIKWKRKQCQMKRRWWIFFFTQFPLFPPIHHFKEWLQYEIECTQKPWHGLFKSVVTPYRIEGIHSQTRYWTGLGSSLLLEQKPILIISCGFNRWHVYSSEKGNIANGQDMHSQHIHLICCYFLLFCGLLL